MDLPLMGGEGIFDNGCFFGEPLTFDEIIHF
jgi:hypothetical protein